MPSPAPAERVTIRLVEPTDLDRLCRLIAEHAAYEHADPPPDNLAEKLPLLHFYDTPRLHALIVTRDSEHVGYATWSLEASTWQGTEYAYMDCLYIRENCRGKGIGKSLLRSIAEAAAEQGANELQWQTPDWNANAVRFYIREGGQNQAPVHPPTSDTQCAPHC